MYFLSNLHLRGEVMIKCKLKVILAERGLKAGWLADKAGISRAAFSSLMNDHSLPTLEVAYKIGEVLELPVEQIWVKVEEVTE